MLSGSLDTSLKLWDATSGNLVKEFKGYKEKEFEKGHREGVFTAAFSPDGKSIVSGSSDRSIKVWNVADGSVTRELVNPNLKPGAWPMAHPGWVYGVRFLPDGRLVSVGGAPRNHGFLATWNVDRGQDADGGGNAAGGVLLGGGVARTASSWRSAPPAVRGPRRSTATF